MGFLMPAPGQQDEANPKERDAKPKLRFICVSSLAEEQKVILASKDDKGNWLELGDVELRSSSITDWLPARAGKLHLATREGENLKSICTFTYPSSSRRMLVSLIADPQKKVYRVDVVDPEKMGFAKGSLLVVNFSSKTGLMLLGSKKVSIKSGGREVIRPDAGSDGMYAMIIAYEDENKKIIPCYDRYVSSNPDARGMIFLLPDQAHGIRVFRLPVFGELE